MDTAGRRGPALLPGLAVFRGYRREWLRGDLLAGVTVAAYLVPQVMAYAALAGLPPEVGLWTALPPLAIYALVGTSRQMSVGPESTTALLTASALSPLARGDPARYGELAMVLAVLVGVVGLIAWVARLGVLADLLSRPVLVGYMAGVAIIMVVSQLGKLTAVSVHGDSFLPELRSFLSHVENVQAPTLALAGCVLAFLLIASRLAPHTPVPLMGILLATGFVALFSLKDHGIHVVGGIRAGLSYGGLDLHTADIGALILPALGIAIVGFSDNMLTARAFAARQGQTVDANQELLALGVTNIGAGLIHGFPVSCSGSRTALGDSLGSRSQAYSLAALGTVLVALFTAGPVLSAFPTAALGALVVYAAIRLIDIHEFLRIGRFRRSELILALGTMVAVLGFGVLYGVLVAVGLSILDLLRRLARPHDGILGQVPGIAGMHDVDDYPDAVLIPGLVVYRYDAPLCFANAEDFTRRALQAADGQGPLEWFLLNAEANVEVDITAVDAIEHIRRELADRGVVFAMARVKQDLRVNLEAVGLVDRIGAEHIFMTLPTALEAFERRAQERPIESVGDGPEPLVP
ncbi:MAG TPA: sulfate permease [Mycobacteriales bacterium]|nr:sulfate permease [Mycobacteriales bacterium]